MNRRITSLSAQKRNPQRVNVYLDGEFAFGLTRIVAAWLQTGMELSEEKIAELKSADESEVNFQRALRYAVLRPRTIFEMNRYLAHRGINQAVAEKIIERLHNNGLLNDHQFAENWVENRSEFRPRSKRALEYELRQRGVDTAIIQASVVAVDEEELAYQAARRQARKIKTSDWREFRQKMLRYLGQRGFNYDTSSDAAQRVWNEEKIMEQQLDEGAQL